MPKPHRNLIRLIAPLFLFQALVLQAQTSTSAPATLTPLPTVSCGSLSGESMGVMQRLQQYNELVRGRQCVVLSAKPADDLSESIKRIPENTVILLSSRTTSPTVTPVTGKTSVGYLISDNIFLKEGQDIIGAADDGFEIVIALHPGFTERYMIGVGVSDDFQFGKARDNHIKHVTFRPTQANARNATYSAIYAQCYNRRLIIENNVFHLPTWAAVYFSCREALDASANNLRPGPSIHLAHNTFVGETLRALNNDVIPTEALFVSVPNIERQSKQIAIVENTFRGKVSEVAEFTIGAGSNADLFRNTIDINNTGRTRSEVHLNRQFRRGAFALLGLRNTSAEPPLFNFAGNHIQLTSTAININRHLAVTLACNQFRAVNLWNQINSYYSLKAIDPLSMADECKKLPGSNATTPMTPCHQIVNTWTAITHSTATPLSGLENFDGPIIFDAAVCPTLPAPTATHHSRVLNNTDEITTASVMTTALGFMATLTVLLNL
ncbi:hypothetical protein [Endozoicomonas sp. SESOKO2]|uniref:hypothetical protein n=1 Tax=Endozoicomonas sp. SESOKO2 TaxID=2828743 RepID=UPI0021488102|nr:hypothetical protein [Endozoicomonas sp. SESOKO2]